jgi:hypothetical protein
MQINKKCKDFDTDIKNFDNVIKEVLGFVCSDYNFKNNGLGYNLAFNILKINSIKYFGMYVLKYYAQLGEHQEYILGKFIETFNDKNNKLNSKNYNNVLEINNNPINNWSSYEFTLDKFEENLEKLLTQANIFFKNKINSSKNNDIN